MNKTVRRILIVTALMSLVIFAWIIWQTYQANNLGFSGKTLWDWLELLVVPTSLGFGAYWLDHQARLREAHAEELQKKQHINRLILQMASPKNEFALEALRQLTALTSLQDGVLRNCNLSGADLNDADLRNANLEGADLSRTRLINATLSGANLENAILFRATLNGTDFGKANLSYIDFKMRDLSLTKRVNLEGSNLSYANLTKSDLSITTLNNVNFSWAILEKTDLKDARLLWANFESANLTGANLAKANLREANLKLAILKDANLSDADLSGAIFEGANLQNTKFGGADFTDANLAGAINWTFEQFSGTFANTIMPDGRTFDEWRAEYEAQQANKD